jgi:hypothetical protein
LRGRIRAKFDEAHIAQQVLSGDSD